MKVRVRWTTTREGFEELIEEFLVTLNMDGMSTADYDDANREAIGFEIGKVNEEGVFLITFNTSDINIKAFENDTFTSSFFSVYVINQDLELVENLTVKY